MVRLLADARGNTYDQKLKDIGVIAMTQSRERGDAIKAFEILNRFNNLNKNE